uniref:Reverse transcriptase RNase H-like domain-containing protein n=1 Tax=Brassica oleracea var. oleracea TaxID=109376 RepID=A0A0D3ASZ3_BRAOL
MEEYSSKNYQQQSIIRFHSGIWLGPQKHYSTVKKEVLAIVNCISKFEDDLINKKFLSRVDCKSAKEILQKDVKNLVSKQIPLLLPSQIQQPSQKKSSPATSTTSYSSQKRSKQSKKEKLAQLIDQLMGSSFKEEDTNNDNNDPFGGPLAQDPFEE